MSFPLSRHVVLFALGAASVAHGQTSAPARSTPAAIYEKARESMVVVRYTWASELGPRSIDSPAVVIDATGVVMCSAAVVSDAVPLKQIRDVKILVPRVGDEPLELNATFEGRDDRCGTAFFKTTEPQTFTPLSFTPAAVSPGDVVTSVSLLGRAAGHKAVIGQAMVAMVSAEGPQVMVDGRFPGGGSVVFDDKGRAVGFVLAMTPEGRSGAQPSVFTPAAAFVNELADRPTPEKPVTSPWIGVIDWNGLKPDEAAYYAIKTPGVHIGGVTPGGALDRAGIKTGQILVGMNGRPLDRGESSDSIPILLRQRLVRSKPGDMVRFDVVDAKNAKPREVVVTLDSVPPLANTAARFFSDELGFGVRDAVFLDRFARRMPADAGGVVVTLVRPGSPAEAGHLPADAFVKEVGGVAVGNVTAFADTLRTQRQAKPGEPVILLVNVNGRDATVRIEPN